MVTLSKRKLEKGKRFSLRSDIEVTGNTPLSSLKRVVPRQFNCAEKLAKSSLRSLNLENLRALCTEGGEYIPQGERASFDMGR